MSYREVMSPQPAWAPKVRYGRFEGKTFYFVRKPIWSFSEQPGTFCIEQAQPIIGGSKFAPPRYGLRTVLCVPCFATRAWACGYAPWLYMHGFHVVATHSHAAAAAHGWVVGLVWPQNKTAPQPRPSPCSYTQPQLQEVAGDGGAAGGAGH